MTPRRLLAPTVAVALALAACGGSDDDAATATSEAPATSPAGTADDFTETSTADEATGEADAPEATAAPAPAGTTPAPAGTEAPAEAPAAPAATTGDGATSGEPPATATGSSGGGVTGGSGAPDERGGGGEVATGAATATLVEWEIDAPSDYAAGEVTFTAVNDGSFPHELVVIEGDGYESLPLADGGAVIEDEIPTGAILGRTSRIGAGSSEDLTVTLAPGTYVLVCNLGSGSSSHAGRGQRLDITVS